MFDYERLFRGLVLDQLKHAKQGNAIAAELIAAKRLAVVHSVINCLACHGRLVRHLRYVIPAACIRDTYEQRKHPQPQNGGGEAFAMALWQTRHDLFDIAGSANYKQDRVI